MNRRVARRRVFFLCPLVAAILLFSRGTAMADLVSGSVDLVYSRFDSKNTDATGQSTQANGTTYFQRYNLGFSTLLYPQLSLQAGSSFDKTDSVVESNDVKTRSTAINIMPTASLVFANPFVTGGAGVTGREEKTSSGGASQPTQFLVSKNTFLMFRPQDLPTLGLQFTRSDRYDKDRQTQNTTTDDFSVNSAYQPVKNLSLSYNGTLDKTNNKIGETTSTTATQSGRASYGRQFFTNRVAFTTDYLRTRSTTETSSGRGALKLPLFPFAGLSAVSPFNASPPPPTVVATLNANQPLIDGNLTASTGINIGQSVSLPPLTDTKFREVGLDFATPTAVNTLDVVVALNQANQDLPADVADNFRWYVYTSPDNQNWTLYQAGLKADFDPFSNRFEITFPDVTTRYIMAAVQPLSIAVIAPPGKDLSNIFITELQAFTTSPATLAGSKTSQDGELYDVNVRTRILDSPMLTHSISYTHIKNRPGISSYTLDNSLNLSHQLSRPLSVAAKVARDDSGDSSGARSITYLYGAALMAAPLPTLNNNLAVSGSRQVAAGTTTVTNSVFLTNSAQLYRGVNVNLSGGETRSATSLGTENDSTTINAGASIVPHQSMTIDVNYGTTTSRSSSQGVQGPVNRSTNATASVAYRPVATVYLFYSISEFSATNAQRQTAQNYSASWSPLSSGTLQLFLSYVENIQSGAAEGFSRLKSAGASWRVGPRINLNATYSITKDELASATTESKNFSTDLAMSF